MRDRDLEIFEMHNRIKKLLLEEQRTVKRIDETKRKALQLQDIRESS